MVKGLHKEVDLDSSSVTNSPPVCVRLKAPHWTEYSSEVRRD